ncbi:MAG: acyltransferase [archaeon]|nr:acyltransferase [archaeon]
MLLFHAGVEFFSGGYVGVDIFFVISGFLITSIIFREVYKGEFTYLNFYERRARRIFPALYFVTFVSIIPAWFFLIPSDFYDFSENIIGVVTFSSNIVLWLQSNYFSQTAELKPLLHTWSLAVEEQYYIFFPIILMVTYRFFKNHIFHLLAFILILSLLLSQWAAFNKPTANYYLFPTRAWELFIGSLVALLYTNSTWNKIDKNLYKYSNILSFLGLILIVIPIFTFDNHTPFPSLYAVIPTVGTALFILFAKSNTLAYKILSNKLFVSIGLISYSAYLWHQPVYAFARQQALWGVSNLIMTFAFCLSLLLAYLSWRFIEQPFRNKNKVSNRYVWLMSFVGGTLLIIFSIVSLKNDGFASRFILKPPLTESNFDLPQSSNGYCFYSVDTDSSLSLGENGFDCFLGAKNGKIKILLFGDSFAGMYEPFWDILGNKLFASVNSITTNWCHPSFSDNFWWTRETRALDQCLMNRKFISESLSSYDIIVISAIWSALEKNGLIHEVNGLIEKLTKKQNKLIIVMAQPPALDPTSVKRAIYNQGQLIYKEADQSIKRLNEMFYKMALENDNLFFIDRASMFKTSNSHDEVLTKDDLPYSWDGGHISIYGSQKAGENFLKQPLFLELTKFIYRN